MRMGHPPLPLEWLNRLALTAVKATLRLAAIVVFLLLFVRAGLRLFDERRRAGSKK
jgi:hypothetical protein